MLASEGRASGKKGVESRGGWSRGQKLPQERSDCKIETEKGLRKRTPGCVETLEKRTESTSLKGLKGAASS